VSRPNVAIIATTDEDEPRTVFDESPVPTLSSEWSDVLAYVDEKATAIGSHIPKSRGVPATARSPEAMLTQEEKAVLLLGRAIGVPWRDIMDTINDRRGAAGILQFSSDPRSASSRMFVSRNKHIVAAIQADLLEAMEAYSPLMQGAARTVHRSRMMEHYRREIVRLLRQPQSDEVQKRIISLDKAMQSHMGFFDRMGVSRDISGLMGSPAERVREQQTLRAAESVRKRMEAGEISELDGARELRALRHGEG
jgi:hypothetical protein